MRQGRRVRAKPLTRCVVDCASPRRRAFRRDLAHGSGFLPDPASFRASASSAECLSSTAGCPGHEAASVRHLKAQIDLRRDLRVEHRPCGYGVEEFLNSVSVQTPVAPPAARFLDVSVDCHLDLDLLHVARRVELEVTRTMHPEFACAAQRCCTATEARFLRSGRLSVSVWLPVANRRPYRGRD